MAPSAEQARHAENVFHIVSYPRRDSDGNYAILCVKFVREVRYFTSKVAIFSLSALVVRKVTGDARRAARGRR